MSGVFAAIGRISKCGRIIIRAGTEAVGGAIDRGSHRGGCSRSQTPTAGRKSYPILRLRSTLVDRASVRIMQRVTLAGRTEGIFLDS